MLRGPAVDSLSRDLSLMCVPTSSQLVAFFFYRLVANGYIYESVWECLSALGGWPAKKDVRVCP